MGDFFVFKSLDNKKVYSLCIDIYGCKRLHNKSVMNFKILISWRSGFFFFFKTTVGRTHFNFFQAELQVLWRFFLFLSKKTIVFFFFFFKKCLVLHILCQSLSWEKLEGTSDFTKSPRGHGASPICLMPPFLCHPQEVLKFLCHPILFHC